MSKIDISTLGIVGCGGAGFPSHIKFSANGVKDFIVNAAECEPLLHKDKEIMKNYTSDFFSGLVKAIDMTGAEKAHIGIKKKYSSIINLLNEANPDSRIHILELGDFYPAGDEYELVYEATGKLIPFGGIPLNIQCVVSNVETLFNLNAAKPVVTKFLTITGEVPNPVTVNVPIGITIFDALKLSGLTSIEGLTIIDGGPMMGKIVNDPYNDVVKKTCGGLIALPNKHILIRKMTRTELTNTKIARSACDQCTDCSELCPRALLGYPIRPHKAMRTAQLSPLFTSDFAIDSIFCSECGLCSLFSCPEDLPPREMSVKAKRFHLKNGVRPSNKQGQPKVHPMRAMRRVSIDRLLKKLGLINYDRKAPLTKVDTVYTTVRLPLKMNVGAPSVPVVKLGEKVKVGQIIAKIPEKKLGAVLHASISGIITDITEQSITIAHE